MPDPIPAEAVQAAMAWLRSTALRWQYVSEDDVRGILEAAAPFLAVPVRREIAPPHATEEAPNA